MSQKPSAHDQALALLARRTHFRRELEAKLAKRGYGEEEVTETLERLEERGWLDDAAAARELVAGKLRRGGYGRARLAAELARRGVERSTTDEVLGELLPEDELPEARAEAERWLRGRRSPKADALARRLQGRGFAAGTIAAVLRELELGG